MIHSVKNSLRRHAINVLGWRTPRKIVVIESDDWGTVRMQSQNAYKYFLNKGYPVDECAYNKFDALESNFDVADLLGTLHQIGQQTGKYPKITINNIVGNPDFDRVERSGFLEYDYELFTDTLRRYPDSDNVLTTYKQGIQDGLIFPQLHGREHVNISKWLADLHAGNEALKQAFDFQMFSLHATRNPQHPMEYMDALGGWHKNQYQYFMPIMTDAERIFQEIWGFKSQTFIAPCFIWNSDLNQLFTEIGIEGLQGQYYQVEPTIGKSHFKVSYHYTGQQVLPRLRYLMRNVTFEPSINNSESAVSKAIKEINTAFLWNRPAIISTHRVNYVGRLDDGNKRRGLNQLVELILNIVKRYPDVEFMFSNELLNEMKS